MHRPKNAKNQHFVRQNCVEDFEELHEYRGRKCQDKKWTQYASWEVSQGESDRSRSVFEHALDVDPCSMPLWLSYTEMELKNCNVQHVRNLFNRYAYLEELLQNIPGTHQVFECWMQWELDDKVWQAYIKMEEHYIELDRANIIYEHWRAIRPEPRVWEQGEYDKTHEVSQTALQFFGNEEEQIEKAQAVFNAFAKMEVCLKDYNRARVIYMFALDHLPCSKSSNLYAAYTRSEKQHEKRRIQYEDEVAHDGRTYDAWFDYAQLEEGALQTLRKEGSTEDEENAAIECVCDIYEQAMAHVPPGQEKRHWQWYIFLWLDYALFEEIETKDYECACQVYHTALNLIPHKQFTFAKLWIMAAQFEIWKLDLAATWKVPGTVIGMCPKEALFKGYIQVEMDLCEFDRVQTLYEKYIEYDPTNSTGWIKLAELETALEDSSQAEAIFELGVSQSALAMLTLLWKAYIDFEVDEQGDCKKAHSLYGCLISLSDYHKVWISYTEFEGSSIPLPCAFSRITLLEAWKAFEQANGTETDVAKVQGMMLIVGRKQHVDKKQIR
ncbi:hypothetical protein SCLCIDRAFT_1211699, partial [Scleroderma citrinum Foug A]